VVPKGSTILPHLDVECPGDEFVKSGEETEIRSTTKFTRIGFPPNITVFEVTPRIRHLGMRVKDGRVI
jgi:hypothetical protein